MVNLYPEFASTAVSDEFHRTLLHCSIVQFHAQVPLPKFGLEWDLSGPYTGC